MNLPDWRTKVDKVINKSATFNVVVWCSKDPRSTTNELAFNPSVDPINKKDNARNYTHRLLDGVIYGNGGWDIRESKLNCFLVIASKYC